MAFCKHRVMDKCKKDNRPCIFSKECCEPEEKKMTNADRIRNMTDDELADMLHNIGSYVEAGEPLIDIFVDEEKTTISDDFGSIKEWLQAEVKEGDSNAS